MKDGRGREIHYLRIAVTDRCNQRCRYCMPEKARFFSAAELMSDRDILKIVALLSMEGVKKIKLTGGEPLLRESLPSLIEGILAIEGIEDLSITTNGSLLAEKAETLYRAGLRRLNISLDALDDQLYRFMTRGGNLEVVIEGIRAARKLGFNPIKVNMTIAAGVNEQHLERVLSMLPQEVELRLIELMPIGSQAVWSKRHHIDIYKLLGGDKGLERLSPRGETSSAIQYRHLATGREIGLIQPYSKEMCTSCGRIRITADGKLKTCLHSASELDLKPLLANDKLLIQSINAMLLNKAAYNSLDSLSHKPINRGMNTIGG